MQKPPEWGEWLREAITLLEDIPSETDTEASNSPMRVKVTLTRSDINQLPLTDTEKSQLTDEDIDRIQSNVELNLHEMIWNEIEAVTFAEIDMKNRDK